MNKKQEQQEAQEHLRETILRGDRLWIVRRHTSKSGMSHYLDVYRFVVDPEYGVTKEWLTYNVAKALGLPFVSRPYSLHNETLCVGGCGFDPGHHVVYELSRLLFGDPNALKHEWV